LLQVASGGTVFLDEIQNMTPALQAKLLRAIETGEVRPVGGTRPKRVDIRIVAASNVDLSKQVETGRFRADLFYRLHRFPIPIPPLRHRRMDILPLAREFLRQATASRPGTEKSLEKSAEDVLLAYEWPGNVRELRSVVERAILLSGARETLGPDLLPPELKRRTLGPAVSHGTLEERVAEFEREIIRTALERNGGVLRRAALELGVHPVTFARRVRRHRLPTA
ncbi:MAG TPA: sigma 54-interacting transcriptional regulator, partial [Myxococcaceae bacterium]|nr:sigma 54-interacting transcriptional regulator [Myxococcaceae bacterium]